MIVKKKLEQMVGGGQGGIEKGHGLAHVVLAAEVQSSFPFLLTHQILSWDEPADIRPVNSHVFTARGS